MADFNPDKFLAENSKGFDPDAFLAGSSVGDDIDTIVDEMHPKIDFMDRAIIKNFGGDTNNAIGYLKKRHPRLEVKASLDGEIIAREKGETEYRKLDPSSFDLQDITDVGTDIGTGFLSSAATAAGGLVGNLPGAVAAGAASSGGLEALRQGIGKALGVNDNISGTDIALSTGFGAASPLLFGSGQSAAGALKMAKGEGMLAKLAKALGQTTGSADDIMSANRGLMGRGYDAFREKITPKLGELSSGVSSDVIRNTRDNLDEVVKIEKQGLTPTVSKLRNEVVDAINSKKMQVGKAIENSLDSADQPVSILPALDEFDDQITKLEKQLDKNPSETLKAKLDKVLAAKTEIFGEEPSQVLYPREAWELAKDLEVLSKANKADASGLGGATATLAEERFKRTAGDASKRLREGIATATANQAEGGTGLLNKAYQNVEADRKMLKTLLKNDSTTYKKLTNINSPSNRVEFEKLKQIDKEYGTSILRNADLMRSFKTFGDAPWLAVSAKGSTSTSRTIPAALVGGALGYYAGAQSGLGQGGAGIGAATGGALGAFIGGPKALRFYMQSQRNLAKMAEQGKKLGLGPQATTKSIWEMMRERDKK